MHSMYSQMFLQGLKLNCYTVTECACIRTDVWEEIVHLLSCTTGLITCNLLGWN